MLSTPVAALLLVSLNVHHGGSLSGIGEALRDDASKVLLAGFHRDKMLQAAKLLGIFAGFQLFLMRFLPGKTHKGPMTEMGHVPVYNANGPQAFFLTVFTFLYGAYAKKWWDASVIYDYYVEMVSFMCLFSLVFCLFLYFKGILAPSSPDHSTSGNPVADYYWGTELYPRIFGWDVKMFTNCRFGMMGWALIVISFAAKNAEPNGGVPTNAMLVSMTVQLTYIAKFFWWEDGYLNSMDIMHDRAGYYICWGCLVWVPTMYVAHSTYLVNNFLGDADIPEKTMWILIVIGMLGIFLNYEADRQRMVARQSKGKAVIFGSPVEMIEAWYTTKDGHQRKSLLLASHLWGSARHFHYVFELTAALIWCVPVHLDTVVPYFYFIFLTILLFDRAFRDDKRCSDKYGPAWDEYRRRVPYKVIPFVV